MCNQKVNVQQVDWAGRKFRCPSCLNESVLPEQKVVRQPTSVWIKTQQDEQRARVQHHSGMIMKGIQPFNSGHTKAQALVGPYNRDIRRPRNGMHHTPPPSVTVSENSRTDYTH